MSKVPRSSTSRTSPIPQAGLKFALTRSPRARRAGCQGGVMGFAWTFKVTHVRKRVEFTDMRVIIIPSTFLERNLRDNVL